MNLNPGLPSREAVAEHARKHPLKARANSGLWQLSFPQWIAPRFIAASASDGKMACQEVFWDGFGETARLTEDSAMFSDCVWTPCRPDGLPVDYTPDRQGQLLEALEAQEAVDDHCAECESCGEGYAPELCAEGFPLADKARLLRRAALGLPDVKPVYLQDLGVYDE
jgi:hypothetical protein